MRCPPSASKTYKNMKWTVPPPMLLKHLRVLCGVPTLVWALNQMFQIFFGPKNLSFYWSDPCRALWVYLWDHLERLTIVMGTFVCAAFVLVSSNDVWCPRPNCFPISTCGVPHPPKCSYVPLPHSALSWTMNWAWSLASYSLWLLSQI